MLNAFSQFWNFITKKEEMPLEIKTAFDAQCAAGADPSVVKDAVTKARQIGLSYHDHSALFHLIIRRHKNAQSLLGGFEILLKGGIRPETSPELFNKVVTTSNDPIKLADNFIALTKEGFAYSEHKDIYQNIEHRQKLSDAFNLLRSAGITHQQSKHLYKMTATSYYPRLLANAFVRLKGLNFNEIEYTQLYQAVVEENSDLDKEIECLAKCGILVQTNKSFYAQVLVRMVKKPNLKEIFNSLPSCGINFQEFPDVYKLILQWEEPITEEMTYSIVRNLNTLFKQGVNLRAPSPLLNPHLLIKHSEILERALEEIEISESDLTYSEHSQFFEKLFSKLSQPEVHYQSVLSIVEKACNYTKENNVVETKDLVNIVESENSLSYGPLDKSEATKTVERLLERLCDDDIDPKQVITFVKPYYYRLDLPQQAPINLTLLLKNANLSHLVLSDELIAKLSKKLPDIVDLITNQAKNTSVDLQNPIALLFPPLQQAAFACYLLGYSFGINQFFRGEALALELDDKRLPLQANENIFVYFVLGCLLNDAVNKIDHQIYRNPNRIQFDELVKRYESHYKKSLDIEACLRSDVPFFAFLQELIYANLLTLAAAELLKPKRKLLSLLYPNKTIKLDRGELIDDAEKEFRLANPWTFPAVTSFSAFKDGSSNYHNSATTRTLLEGTGQPWIVKEMVGEVLVTHGSQVITVQGTDRLISRLVRSPSIQPRDHFWSDTALEVACTRHLDKAYSLDNHARVINGVTIARPNHGRAHTYRVMEYIDYLADYFAHFASDPEFKVFCQTLSDADREWLRVAAAFSVTGRESEMSATENPKLYDTFRQASAEHFKAFVNETKPDADVPTIERMQHILRYMGNPQYEKATDKPQVNVHPDEKERKLRNFYHRLLTFSHNLDLVRCYNAEHYTRSTINPCTKLAIASQAQQRALQDLVRYAIELNKKHGNALGCDITSYGNLINVDMTYRDVFANVSQSWHALYKATQRVTKPQTKLGFEFVEPQKEKAQGTKRTHDDAGNDEVQDKKIGRRQADALVDKPVAASDYAQTNAAKKRNLIKAS